jgi:hypothetical protein
MTQTKVEAPFVENSRPFRNLIINGDMQIAQRGTSQSSVANDASEGYSTVDRFGLYFFNNEGGVATVSQDTTVPSDTTYGKFSKSLKIDVTTADTSIGATGSHAIKHTIESSFIHHSGWDYTSSSSKITLQFWAQSVKAGDYHVMFRCHDASGERYYVTKYTLVANTWKHIEIVVPGNSALVFNDDNGEGLEVRWNLSAGDDRNDATADTWFAPGSDYDQSTNTQVNFFDSTDNNFFLTGVQLEVGDVASGFEHLPHDIQLRRCERYCHKWISEGTYDNVGRAISTTGGARPVYYVPTTMRNGPSLSADGNFRCYNATDSTVSVAAGDVTMSRAGPNTQYLNFAASLTAEKNCECGANNDNTAFIIFDSEL